MMTNCKTMPSLNSFCNIRLNYNDNVENYNVRMRFKIEICVLNNNNIIY